MDPDLARLSRVPRGASATRWSPPGPCDGLAVSRGSRGMKGWMELRWVLAVPLALAACGGSGDGDPAADSTATSPGSTAGGDDTGAGVDGPTWHQDVAPVVYAQCVGCHKAGGVGPFSVETYEEAKGFAGLMASSVMSGEMPPWHAEVTDECQPPFDYRDNPHFSDAERQLLADWAAAGAPEGDPSTALELPAPQDVDLADPDGVFNIGAPITVNPGEDQFWCASLDLGNTEDVWVTADQVVVDNGNVLHHVLIFSDPDGESASRGDENGIYPCFGDAGLQNATLMAAWVPGALPYAMPEGSGFRIPAGGRLVLNIHYHPTATVPEQDQSGLALKWTTTEPDLEARMFLLGNFRTEAQGLMPGEADDGPPRFLIPAGAKGHVESMEWEIEAPRGFPVKVFAVGNHMHYVGTDMKLSVESTGGDETCLLQTPRWDFDWQRVYAFDVPLDQTFEARGGDKVKIRCTYDNSLDNPKVQQALAEQGLTEPQDVTLGESSLDEMCLGAFGIAY